MKGVMTIRIGADLKNKLDRMAKATARTKSYLIEDAIREYLEVNGWQIEAIQEGVRQADAGQLVPHETVQTKWEGTRADSVDPRRRPRS